MSFETSSCKLHGDYGYNPTFSPLMDECNIFEVSPCNVNISIIKAEGYIVMIKGFAVTNHEQENTIYYQAQYFGADNSSLLPF